MKNKKSLFILLGVVVVCFIGVSIFFALQGISAANKRQEYFDVYREKAEEYIKWDSEVLKKYGNDVSVEFDSSVTYRKNGKRGFFDRYIDVFAPYVPNTLEEFVEGIEMIKFDIKINGDKYEITFEKNSAGELVVSNLTEVK
ncbi:MAG: hypothetical protein IJO86_02085 [Oscillospiraceae bacterium]|nr:hypothetical protein [Oscillospiraceae bacterium]